MSRNQYPDYISYLKKRKGDREFNKGLVAQEVEDVSGAKIAFQNAMFLNFNDVEAKYKLKGLEPPYNVKVDDMCVQRGKACE